MADPLARLFDEHGAVRAQLKALESALDAAMNRNEALPSEREAMRAAVGFLRTDLEAHLRREDTALLPALEAAVGRFGTLVNVIAYDHEEIRREVGKFTEAVDGLEARADAPHEAELREVNRHGIFLVQYLSLHMAKEESSVADLARDALGKEGLQALATQLEAPG